MTYFSAPFGASLLEASGDGAGVSEGTGVSVGTGAALFSVGTAGGDTLAEAETDAVGTALFSAAAEEQAQSYSSIRIESMNANVFFIMHLREISYLCF